MSLGDVSGPLRGTPVGAAPNAFVVNTNATTPVERHNGTQNYITNFHYIRGILACLRS